MGGDTTLNYTGPSAFLRYGEAPLDNNKAEQALKPEARLTQQGILAKAQRHILIIRLPLLPFSAFSHKAKPLLAGKDHDGAVAGSTLPYTHLQTAIVLLNPFSIEHHAPDAA